MKYTDIMTTLRSEVAIFYRAKPSVASIKKMKLLGRKLNKLDFDEDNVIAYVDYCYKRIKKIKDAGKRASVDYFIAITTSEKNFDSFIDFRRTTGELRKEDPTDDDEDDHMVKIDGATYVLVLSEEDRDIFWSEKRFNMYIRDLSRMVPKLMTLKQYNEAYPNNKITVKTISHLIEEGKLCLT